MENLGRYNALTKSITFDGIKYNFAYNLKLVKVNKDMFMFYALTTQRIKIILLYTWAI